MLLLRQAHANGGGCSGTVTVDMMYWRAKNSGDTIAETDGAGSTTNSNYHEYIILAGWGIIARSTPSSGNVYYHFVDHLGSTRVVTNEGGVACYEVDYLPYGTENTPSGFSNTCSTRYRFSGYERDAETAYGTSAGNDYAFARYYSQRLQRFMSPDPKAGDKANPQSLNPYSYVLNNSLNRIDPTGLDSDKAAMEMPLQSIIPLWEAYLHDVARRRTVILSLPLSTVFDSEAAFRRFTERNGISTEQVKQLE